MRMRLILALLVLTGCGDDASTPTDGGPGATDAMAADAAQPSIPGTFVDRGRVLEPTTRLGGMDVPVPASDPSVLVDGDVIRMAFTCVDYTVDPPATQICESVSSDGTTWSEPSVVLRGGIRESRYAYEGAELVATGDEVRLLASWYPAPEAADPDIGYGFPATLALHRLSDDGYEFVSDVLTPTPGPSADAVYSPAVHSTGEGLLMVYAAHCYPRPGVECGDDARGVQLEWATAEGDSASWTRRAPISVTGGEGWSGVFLAEPELLSVGSRWLLLVTAFERRTDGEKPVAIGLALADSPEGPFVLREQPFVRAADVGARYVVAPSAVVRDDELWVYYTWLGDDELQRIALTVALLDQDS